MEHPWRRSTLRPDMQFFWQMKLWFVVSPDPLTCWIQGHTGFREFADQPTLKRFQPRNPLTWLSFAEVSWQGTQLHGRDVDVAINSVPMTAVVDAKDVHDKGNSDTASYGSQKSLAFTIAWLRSALRRPNFCLKWTATSNMWVDGLTKDMDLSHLRKILQSGKWSISYSPEFLKQVGKAKQPKPSSSTACAGDELPGTELSAEDPILPHLARFADQKGWHALAAYNAKSYRTHSLVLAQLISRCDHLLEDLRSAVGMFGAV